MPESEGGRISNRQRPPLLVWIIPLLVGLLGFYRVTQSPQFESYRTVDVVQLLVSGACLGVVLTGAMLMLLQPRFDANRYRSAEFETNVKQS
jgi:hypothetical protein